MSLNLSNDNNYVLNLTEGFQDKDRDERYKEILRRQLGPNGITLSVNLTFLFISMMIVLLMVFVSSINIK
ncbi:unknown [Gryllus bimaculatus nudivirus]|uniref:Uncharacterized protein n=1 Tax=Gryllus bimaculatus nudivirus TaxID=432587 RepID=A4L222_9VIRU|nr:hypothetical protein GrBNV_gp59 [Gryllus bimaculatus nudivirus]ABO45392.1 unknown [Gryllus bimaculatus nudivirus]